MEESRQGNPVNGVVALMIANAVNGLASAALGLYISENAISAIGAVLALAALCVAMNLRTLKTEWWNYAVVLNIAAVVLYITSDFIEFLIVGEVLSILTLILLFSPPVKGQFK
ncbi:MAG: hypothetical protein QXS20_04310 [Candidatus Thorarchaeota archaeon]